MMHVPPAGTARPLAQGVISLVFLTVASAKSPLMPRLEMLSVPVPLLVSETFFAAVVVPTAILPHFREVGESLADGPRPPEPTRALIRAAPFGLPQPVTKS